MNEWIKVSERMPETLTPVLVYGIADNDTREPMIAVYERMSFRAWTSVGDCGYEHEDSISAPTHWMPLPEPPK
jgi:hypothetical protein